MAKGSGGGGQRTSGGRGVEEPAQQTTGQATTDDFEEQEGQRPSVAGTLPQVQGTPVTQQVGGSNGSQTTGAVARPQQTAEGNVVSDLEDARKRAEERLDLLDTEMERLDQEYEQKQEAIRQQHEADKGALQEEKDQIMMILGLHVTPEKSKGRGGRPKGSKNKTPKAAVVSVQPAKKKDGRGRGRRGSGPTASDLIVTLVHGNAPDPTPLKDIRNHLRANGKQSNPTMETGRLVEQGYLRKNPSGEFLPGRKQG